MPTIPRQAITMRTVRGVERILRFDPVSRRRLSPTAELVRLGSDSCSWFAPARWPRQKPICYCVGAGEDISFDLALARRFDAEVHIFDPTPRAIRHAAGVLGGRRDSVLFHPWAVWSHDTEVELFEPANPEHVSHSIVNLQSTTRSFTAPGRSLSSIMSEFGHDRIDLLKLDIEGAEYAVVKSFLAEEIRIGVLDIEFDELSVPRRGAWNRIRRCIDTLEENGFRLVAVDEGSNYTFICGDFLKDIN